MGSPGKSREHGGPEPSPVDGQLSSLGAEHEHVDAQAQDQQQRDGVARCHDGVQRRACE